MPQPLEFQPQLRRVVDLAVVRNPDCPVLARHRLLAQRRQVDDRQSAMPEPEARASEIATHASDGVPQPPRYQDGLLAPVRMKKGIAFAVRPSVRQRAGHPLEEIHVQGSLVHLHDPRYAAHDSTRSRSRPATRRYHVSMRAISLF